MQTCLQLVLQLLFFTGLLDIVTGPTALLGHSSLLLGSIQLLLCQLCLCLLRLPLHKLYLALLDLLKQLLSTCKETFPPRLSPQDVKYTCMYLIRCSSQGQSCEDAHNLVSGNAAVVPTCWV